MIWFAIPALLGATGGWFVTKETVTDVLEANQSTAPLVNVGTQNTTVNKNTLVLMVVFVVLAWFFFVKKGKIG